MPEPLVLYRSVSRPGLEDLWRTGAIRGGGNRFNAIDARPYVFFAAELTDLVIAQGEDLRRRAKLLALDHPACARADALVGYQEQQAKRILAEMDRDRIRHRRAARDLFVSGYLFSEFRRAVYRSPGADRRKYAILFHGLKTLFEQYERASREVDHLFAAEMDRLDQEQQAAPFTSAVLVTRPLSGGLMYSVEFGFSGMNDEPEYGFRSGYVKLSDLTRILLMKFGRSMREMDPAELGSLFDADIRLAA